MVPRDQKSATESAEGVSRVASPSVRATRSTKAKERQEKRKCMSCEAERRTLARQVDWLSIGRARVKGAQTRGKVGPRLPAFNGARCKVKTKDSTAGPATMLVLNRHGYFRIFSHSVTTAGRQVQLSRHVLTWDLPPGIKAGGTTPGIPVSCC